MPVWKSRPATHPYDANVAFGRKPATYDVSAGRTFTAQQYDHSAATWPQNTMAVRPHVQKPYDANLMKSTMSKEFATSTVTPFPIKFVTYKYKYQGLTPAPKVPSGNCIPVSRLIRSKSANIKD
jgi:hypothetical protein